MKKIQAITAVLFCLLLLLPLCTFQFEEEAMSKIDNRMLAKNPIAAKKEGADFSESIEAYVSDRIGFREDMILSYTVFNDKVFHKMVHPSYTYGKEGWIFGSGIHVDEKYDDYLVSFTEALVKMQAYCSERNVPFLFVFCPSKPAVYSEYLANGIAYDRTWVDAFLHGLEEKGIAYLDLTKILTEKKNSGEMVYNQKFDANHWNDLGAFYGTTEILKTLQKSLPNTYINQKEDFFITTKLEESLLVSEFPIHEETPQFIVNEENIQAKTDAYASLFRYSKFPEFGYTKNANAHLKDTPKLLAFQSSYMNVYGTKFMKNAFQDYIYVHNYQNVINLPYYFNIFKPDCVIFEVAEHTLYNSNFYKTDLEAISYNPAPESLFSASSHVRQEKISKDSLSLHQDKALTTMHWKAPKTNAPMFLLWNEEYYDLFYVDGEWVTTISDESNTLRKEDIKIVRFEDGTKTTYSME